MIHQITYKDEKADVNYFCDPSCASDEIEMLKRQQDQFEHGAVPTHPETDYDVHCGGCGTLLWEAITSNMRTL